MGNFVLGVLVGLCAGLLTVAGMLFGILGG